MGEDLSFVDRLHRDLREVRWPEPAEIRARARRRSRRTAVLATAATLALVSGSAAAVAGRPTAPLPVVPVAPVAALTRAEIPVGALLAPADVPTSTGVRLGETGLAETVRVDPLLESCGRERGVSARLPVSRSSRSQTLLHPAAGNRAPAVPALSQDVYRLEPPGGRWLFGEIDRLLNACAEWRLSRSTLTGQEVQADEVHRWELPVRDFAGDQSMLLRHVSQQPGKRPDERRTGAVPQIETTLVVRVGDLVTVVEPAPDTVADQIDGGPGMSFADLTALGRTAAKRMCPTANPPC
ncbi:hypothetical protein [Micromonospora sp. NPDC092111]|uniref:hypothetical protein n=1 Tax=Micromonospora sp. NPDC092111 TaxID=3364289 RepID=UPI00381FBD11